MHNLHMTAKIKYAYNMSAICLLIFNIVTLKEHAVFLFVFFNCHQIMFLKKKDNSIEMNQKKKRVKGTNFL